MPGLGRIGGLAQQAMVCDDDGVGSNDDDVRLLAGHRLRLGAGQRYGHAGRLSARGHRSSLVHVRWLDSERQAEARQQLLPSW